MESNLAYGVSETVSTVESNPAHGVSETVATVESNPAYGVSETVATVESNPAYGVSETVENRQISTDDDLYELDLPAIDKTIIENKRISGDGSLYECVDLSATGKTIIENKRISGDGSLYECVDLSATGKTNNEGVTASAQGELKNGNSRKASLVIGIALSTAVLALVVAMVSVGLSAALNSNSEIQSLLREVEKLQLNLCILNQTVNNIQDTIHEQSDLQSILQQQVASQTQLTSCSEIPTDRPSGEYWILGNSSSVRVYCDMNRTCCNTTGVWMRVAHLDMTDSNQQCPDGFLLHNENTAPLRTCGRPGPAGCISTTFPVHGIEYSRVCGRVRGYQFGEGVAFYAYYKNRSLNLNDHYVDGITLTHGQLPQQHIWTLTVALDEVDTRTQYTCPCTQPDITYTGVVPPFIGQDYFCDTGSRDLREYVLYRDDPLWNGQGCGRTSTCCSFNNPPWFCKQLPQPTSDDIKLRECFQFAVSIQDMFIELVDIFVQ